MIVVRGASNSDGILVWQVPRHMLFDASVCQIDASEETVAVGH